MRHVLSIVVALILGALTYVLLGVSLASVSRVSFEGWSSDEVIVLLTAVGAGLTYAVLLLPRLSPVGPALVGVAYLSITIWVISDLQSFSDAMPDSFFGRKGAGVLPSLPVTAVLAVPLLATVLSGRRWRPTANPAGQFPGGGMPPFGSPGGPQPMSDPSYGAPAPYGTQQSQPYGTPPLGTPYSGPPSYSPGSPVAPAYPDPSSPYGSPQSSFGTDQTRRI